jgi:hypothetical protein
MAVPASAAKADMYAAFIGLSRCGISCRLYDELIGAPTLTQTVQIKDSVDFSRVDDAPRRADPRPACADVEPAGRADLRDLLKRQVRQRKALSSEHEAAEERQIDHAHHLQQWVEVAYRIETAEPAARRHAIVALHGPPQRNVPIQSTMAFPISSGESS